MIEEFPHVCCRYFFKFKGSCAISGSKWKVVKCLGHILVNECTNEKFCLFFIIKHSTCLTVPEVEEWHLMGILSVHIYSWLHHFNEGQLGFAKVFAIWWKCYAFATLTALTAWFLAVRYSSQCLDNLVHWAHRNKRFLVRTSWWIELLKQGGHQRFFEFDMAFWYSLFACVVVFGGFKMPWNFVWNPAWILSKGDRLSFNCEAAGFWGKNSYTWEKDGDFRRWQRKWGTS